MASSVKSVVIIFGPYEFSPYSGELRKEGMRVRLEGQPLTILQVLLDRPGELVSRDELLKKLWPGDTFVDFEHSLNAAVKRLRAALNDPAEQPHYIETLARRGYRFIAPVKMADDQIGIAAFAVTPALGVAHPPLAVGGRRWSLIAVVVCVVAIVAWGWRQWWHRTATPAVPAIRSLAVLPLENLSGDPSQEYFADGMTEELIGRLSNLHGLRVISRTSAMQFKHTQLSLPEIARTLRVDAIVEGSVMREGARIRVHAQLIRGATDEHFWSKTYDRELGNALQVEGEVSQAIADEVGIKITPQEQNRLQRKPTPNPEAREAYLRARYFLERDDKEGATKCLQYFREAIAKDPSYAAAYAGLSRCYVLHIALTCSRGPRLFRSGERLLHSRRWNLMTDSPKATLSWRTTISTMSGISMPLSGSTNGHSKSIPTRRTSSVTIHFSFSESGDRMKRSRKYIELVNWIRCPLAWPTTWHGHSCTPDDTTRQ